MAHPETRFQYYLLVVILGGLSAMGPLAIDMYLPSFPAIAREFGAPASAVQATVAIYFIGLASGQLFYGPLSDRLGRRGPLFFGLILFIGASIGCAFATSVRALILWRVLQALGGCAEMMVARAVVRDRFDARDGVRVLSLLILVMGLAPILAPLAGGQLLVTFGWRSIFWALAGYGTFGLVAVALLLPESLPPERRRQDSLREVFGVYGALMRDREYMALRPLGRPDHGRHVRVHRSLAVRVHRAVPCRPAAVRSVLRDECAGTDHGIAGERPAGPPGESAGDSQGGPPDDCRGRPRAGDRGLHRDRWLRGNPRAVVRVRGQRRLRAAEHDGAGDGRRTAGSPAAPRRCWAPSQFLLGAGAAALAGALGSATAVPMAVVVAGCACGAFVIHHAVPRSAESYFAQSA